MSENGALGLHLNLENVECTALEGSRAIVRLRGIWHGERRDAEAHTMLIVEAGGHRHHFPALPPFRERQPTFSARFALPARLVPQLGRHGSVAVGQHLAGVPKLQGLPSAMFEKGDGEHSGGADDGEHEHEPDVDAELGRLAGAEPPVSAEPPEPHDGSEELLPSEAPLSELREALRQRATTEAQLRGELADLRAELSSRSAAAERFEEMREALRAELERVVEFKRQADSRRDEIESRAMVLAAELADAQHHARELEAERDRLTAQLRDGRGEIQAARAAAEASAAEVTALHAELGRLEGELTAARTAQQHRESGLEEAESLLSQARALTAELGEE